MRPAPVPKFTDGKMAQPMVTFIRAKDLHSFEEKRKELNGKVDLSNLIAKQRRAIM